MQEKAKAEEIDLVSANTWSYYSPSSAFHSCAGHAQLCGQR